MSVTQLAVFIENKPGRLLAVTRILGDAGVNIRGYSIADTAEYGILRLLVDKLDVARIALRENDFSAHESQVVLVEVPDRPGGVAHVLDSLAAFNIEYTYPTATHCLIAFGVEKVAEAETALQQAGVHVLTDEKLAKI